MKSWTQPAQQSLPEQLALGVRLRTHAVFESFAPGPNLELIEALRGAATGLAAPPALCAAPPLWLWGAHGSGKTHLLQAACAAVAGAAYFPLDRVTALPPAALAGFERSRVLCLDDVDAVAGDPKWERALFGLFNDAADLGTRLIFAAGAAPRGIDWRLDDWQSRAGACVVYQLRDLDDAGRVEALRLRAQQRGLQLPPETADYLLRRMPRDLPSLIDVLDQLDEASLIAQRRLTVPFIRAALEKLAGTRP